jgi:hypothetical protein
MAGSIGNNVLNIGGADPVQGYDVGVWVRDAQDGTQLLLGQFTSIVVTIRNATEAYMEFGQRYPRYLDGEMQIAFVMEKGLLDLNAFQETFGFKQITREKRFGRSPRLTITFSVDPVDAAVLEGDIATDPLQTWGSVKRDVTGRFVLQQCKIDSWHFAATAGRQVVATQWQGVAEGFAAIPGDFTATENLQTPSAGDDGQIIGGSNWKDNKFIGGAADAIASTNKNVSGYDA